MEMEGDTAVDSIKIKTMSIKIKAQPEIPCPICATEHKKKRETI